MADFCKECSEELFGEDFGDLAKIALPDGEAYVLCEGCGYIVVDREGKRVRKITEAELRDLDVNRTTEGG